MEEHKDEGDLGSLAGQPVGVTAVTLDQTMRLHFAQIIAELMGRLEGTVAEAVAALRGLAPERLTEMYQPQKYHVTILEGIYSCVEHFAQHTAQIIFATKLLTGQDMGFYKHLNQPNP